MTEYCGNKTELVQYVADMLKSSALNYPWIMTIRQGPYAGYYVHIAIGESLGVTVENTQDYLSQLTNTSQENTPGG